MQMYRSSSSLRGGIQRDAEAISGFGLLHRPFGTLRNDSARIRRHIDD